MAKNEENKVNGKTVEEVLATLNDEQKKAVAILVSVAVQKELESIGVVLSE